MPSVETQGASLADAVIAWQAEFGRHGLPWQGTQDPYRIWVSEIMLQQTQVSTVLGYYDRFLGRFPSVATLADADLDEVLRYWSGLGYYSRARNLHACAKAIMAVHAGVFPVDPIALEALPGIGRSTAAAIAAFSAGVMAPILDGNVRRVLCRVFAVEGFPGERAVLDQLWMIAQRELPQPGPGRIEAYTQGLMDLGATVCLRARPRCEACPVNGRCQARAQDRVDALPTPRPRRSLELRTAHWVMICRSDQVLLERRPASGLWGGLWSLPEVRPPRPSTVSDDTVDAPQVMDFLGQAFGLASRHTPARLGVVRHVFTHFRLAATVWRINEVDDGWPALPGCEWVAWRDVERAPLPKPVRTLLLDQQMGSLEA